MFGGGKVAWVGLFSACTEKLCEEIVEQELTRLSSRPSQRSAAACQDTTDLKFSM